MRADPLLAAAMLAVPGWALAAVIDVSPSDGYAKIEAAQAGDTVVFAPGTYTFRLDFQNAGTPDAPIVLRARDPANRPVFDPSPAMVSAAPGSSTAGDRGRGCWQFRAPHYRVDGLVFRNCVDHSSSGLRVVNVDDIQVRHSLFVGNTNGMIGAGDGTVIEFSEFDGNGDALSGDPPAHQIYIYGGTLAVRFSYFHDSPAGQGFHVRARDATLEYNWVARPGSYVGDMMSCEYLCGGSGTSPITQHMLLRGNVLVQGPATGANNLSQTIALVKDGGDSSDGTGTVSAFDLTLVGNAIVGTPLASGRTHTLVHLVNGNVEAHVHALDNAATDYASFALVDDAASANWSVDGAGNWLTTGTDPSTLTAPLFGASPGWSAGYVPLAGSALIGGAVDAQALSPAFEYFRDEGVTLQGRARAAARDIGAFESTTQSAPFDGWDAGDAGTGDAGPGDASTAFDGGAADVGGSDAGRADASAGDAAGGGDAADGAGLADASTARDAGGQGLDGAAADAGAGVDAGGAAAEPFACGCRAGGGETGPAATAATGTALWALWGRRRHRRGSGEGGAPRAGPRRGAVALSAACSR